MIKSVEKKFEELSQEVQQKAAAIECSPEDYREGLGMIIDDCDTAILASTETSEKKADHEDEEREATDG